MVLAVSDKKLYKPRDGLENTVSTHRDTTAPTLSPYCIKPDRVEEGIPENNPCSKIVPGIQQKTDNLYVVDKTFCRVGSGL